MDFFFFYVFVIFYFIFLLWIQWFCSIFVSIFLCSSVVFFSAKVVIRLLLQHLLFFLYISHLSCIYFSVRHVFLVLLFLAKRAMFYCVLVTLRCLRMHSYGFKFELILTEYFSVFVVAAFVPSTCFANQLALFSNHLAWATKIAADE